MIINKHELRETTIAEVVRNRAADLGDRPFAIVEDVTLTFAAADSESNRIANSLQAAGVKKGDIVVTYMYNSTDHLSAWFACAKLGAIFAPVNIALKNLDLAYTLNDAAPKALIIDAELLENYLPIRDRIQVEGLVEVVRGGDELPAGGRDFAELLQGSEADPGIELKGADPAGIIYTGGSTGLPKGVLVSNLWYFPAVVRYDEMFGVRPDDVHFGLGQMYHAIGSAVDAFCPMYAGIPTVMSRWFSASRFWDIVDRHRTSIVGVFIGPLMMALTRQPPRPNEAENSVRIASSASGQVPRQEVEAFADRFGIELLEIYGQTETGPLGAVGQRLDDRPYHSQGRPHGWCEVAVVDENDLPCAPDEQGEIVLRPTVPHTFMLGYHNQPDRYVEATQNFWFHSGDVGKLDERGYLHFEGRLAHSIRRRGENISAFEVEQAMMLHPAVAECAVVGVEAELGEEDVKAFIELAEGHEFEPGELIRFCEEQIAYFKVPRYLEVIEAMPRSASKNEIERFRLRERGIGDAWDREAAGYSVRRNV